MTSSRARSLAVLLALAASILPAAAADGSAACVPRTWTISLVDPNVTDIDSYVSATKIFLDAAGHPNVFYANGPLGSMLDGWRFEAAVQKNGDWRTRRLPANPASSRPSVATDSLGRVHLAWRSGTFFGEGILNYARIEDGNWFEEIVDDTPGGTSYVSIAVDAAGNPHIVYTGELAGMPMRYASWDGAAWQKEDVSSQGGILSPSLALDSTGQPRVAYLPAGGAEVDYAARYGGTWSVEPVSVVSPYQSLEVSLVLDATDQPHVAFDQLYDVGIAYAHKDVYGIWMAELVEAGQRWDPDLVVGPGGIPQMVFYDAEHGALRYATRASGAWCAETVEDDASDLIRIGRNPSLVLDGEGRAHVAYHYHDIYSACQVKHAVSEP